VAVDKAERPVLPQTAVMSDRQGTFVYIVDANNHVVRRPVVVGGTIEAGVVIASGLTGEERIIGTAGGFLRDGEPVAVAPNTDSAAPATAPPTAKDART
jgi:multidrug efflux pump subunit AcrA (membrane-fusion protein)